MLSQIATIKTTCAQFQQPSPTVATRGEAELRIYNLKKKRHLPSVGQKQLRASAHLGCTREVDTF